MNETEHGSARYARRPEGSNWGDFGPDDQLGRLNLLTPERVRAAVAEVEAGVPFCLSLPLDLPGGSKWNPRRRPPVIKPTIRNGKSNICYQVRQDNPEHTDVLCDDMVTLYTQYSTQWDSLAQVGQLYDISGNGVMEPCFYNGYRAERDVFGVLAEEPLPDGSFAPSRARALGIENMAASCVQGRGVMIDLEAHFGRERRKIGYRELQQVMQHDGIVVEPGDMVCFHTGFAEMLVEMGGDPDVHVLENSCAELDGRDPELLNWVSESNLSVIISDNHAVEVFPSGKIDAEHYSMIPLHELCLFKLGIHIGELWHLTPLARWLRRHERSRFLLTAPPLRLPGAVASPATPVATV
jgi:kynurenine formamidase